MMTPHRHPLIVAHRGASLEAPENSIAAISRAIELGVDGIEFDVLLTRDRTPVVTHNDNLSILTKYRGRIRNHTYHDLIEIDCGSHFSEEFKDTRIATLTEVLALLETKNPSHIVIDVKPQPGMLFDAANIVGNMVSKYSKKDSVIISCSSFWFHHHLRRLYPTLRRSLLIEPRYLARLQEMAYIPLLKPHALVLFYPTLSKALVDRLHARGIQCYTWPVNSKEELNRCRELGIEMAIVDDVRQMTVMDPGE